MFFKCIANKENENTDYEILSSKVDDINFYDILYDYLSKFDFKKTSVKNKLLLIDLSKGFNLKSAYTTNGENNIEKAYDNLVLNNKKIDDVIYKKVKKKSLVIKIRIFSRKQKSCLI